MIRLSNKGLARTADVALWLALLGGLTVWVSVLAAWCL